jgi:hypothetical protein
MSNILIKQIFICPFTEKTEENDLKNNIHLIIFKQNNKLDIPYGGFIMLPFV